MFLCEVALGKMKPHSEFDYDAHKNLNGFDSVFGEGTYGCSEEGLFEMSFFNIVKLNFRRFVAGDIVMCPGSIKYLKEKTLEYNEYVVYDPNQIHIRYLVKVLFGPSHIPPSIHTASPSNYLAPLRLSASNFNVIFDSILQIIAIFFIMCCISVFIPFFIAFQLFGGFMLFLMCILMVMILSVSIGITIISKMINMGVFILSLLFNPVFSGIKFVASKLINMGIGMCYLSVSCQTG
jgi:hypothetical protein